MLLTHVAAAYPTTQDNKGKAVYRDDFELTAEAQLAILEDCALLRKLPYVKV